MRILFFLVAFLAMIIFSAPVWASLPYYNPDMGYTIWLPNTWNVVPVGELETAEGFSCPVPVHDMAPEWRAGYVSPAGGPVLLVEVRPGRKMHAADISNFNRFVIRSIRRSGSPVRLKDATYIGEKKTLRIESEVEFDGRTMLSLTYIVYTRKGILNFVGFAAPGDDEARSAIDKAVLSLYLDDSVRYESR
jgi:hypothetical protein